jgi:predicted transcriptional regulator of viral defense system
MYLTYKDCRERFGSPYQIDKAVRDGLLKKVEVGVYSDCDKTSELEIIQFKYPKGILTFDSADFYYDLTDVIPDLYHLAMPSNATVISDSRIKQYYIPQKIYSLGITEIEYCGDKVRTYDLERLLIETARMKSKLPPELYKEIILSFRAKENTLSKEKIGHYLPHFPKKNMIERILYEEVF